MYIVQITNSVQLENLDALQKITLNMMLMNIQGHVPNHSSTDFEIPNSIKILQLLSQCSFSD